MTLHRWGISSSNGSLLQVEDIIELLNIPVKTMHFQCEYKFSHKKYGMEMGSSLLPVVSYIFMEHFLRKSLGTAGYKPAIS
jgi:hypothetical protein